MFTGLTAANVPGVPFGTFLCQELGWRSTFWAIVAIGVLALAGILALVPADRAHDGGPGLAREFGVFRSGHVPPVLVRVAPTHGSARSRPIPGRAGRAALRL